MGALLRAALTPNRRVDDGLQAVIRQRDAYEDFIADLAADLGCWQEWTNAHDHRACVAEAIATLQARPKVGVSTLVRRADGKILLGLRKGAHGAGTWATPGGHLEVDESVERCAARELAEETGIEVDLWAVHVMRKDWTHDREPREWGTYLTLWCQVVVPARTQASVLEPHKCEEWRWVGPDEAPPGPLFRCLQSAFDAGFLGRRWDAWSARGRAT